MAGCGYFATEILIDSSSAVTGVVDRLDWPIELVVGESEYPNLFFRTSFEGGWADSITWLNGLYQPETEKDPLNHVSRFSYSSDGLLLSLIRENGSTPSVWTYQYDVLGQLIESRNPEQQGVTGTNTSTTYAYDALGRLTGISYPRVMSLLANEQLPATTESFTYDLLDQLLSSSKTGSPTVSYAYDARGRLTTQTIPDPDGSLGVSALITTYQYNVVGQPTLVTNPLGSKEKYEYDALGRLEKYYAPSQSSSTYSSAYTKYSYNAAGLTTAVDAPLVDTASWTYDQRGQLLTHQPAGIVGQYEYLYDPVGRPTGVVDPLGISTSTSYADNRVASTTDGKGGITSYAYDANGNLTSLTDPVGNETSWQYNALNLPVVETKESGHSRYFEYDRNGSLTKRTDRTGKAIRYTYDLLGQLRVEDWLDGTSVVNQFYYEYGAADQLKYVGEKSAEPSAIFPSAGFFGNQVSLTYDSWGRVTGDAQQWDRITSKLSRVDYVYSGANWQPTVTNVTYAGASALQSQTTTSYNLRGEVTSIQQKTPNPFGSTVTEPSGFNLKTVTYQRDLLGRTTEIQRSFKAGTSSPVAGPGTGIGYDGAGRIDDITHSLLGTGVIAGYEFTYDADSRITSIQSYRDGLMSYTYDNTHQLTAVTYSTPLPKHPSVHVVGLVTNSGGSVTGESFAYDANGNNSALTVSDDNIVTSDGTYSYDYDEEGRPITRTAANGTVTTYTWDHRGRLVKVEETLANSSPSLGASAGTVVTFSYDPLDRRIGKFVQFLEWRNDACFNCWQPNPEIEWYVQPAGGQSSHYVYDGQHISLELRSVTNESQATSDVYRRIMHGVAIDEVLAEETVWGTSWALSDHLGTIHDWVDATTGTITHYVYSAFGRILSINGGDPSLDTHLFGFTGRETDADTLITDHWMYYRARYYNPSTGRFVSQDPIGFAAGDANLYRYVSNSTVHYVDPTGHSKEGNGPFKPKKPVGPPPGLAKGELHIIVYVDQPSPGNRNRFEGPGLYEYGHVFVQVGHLNEKGEYEYFIKGFYPTDPLGSLGNAKNPPKPQLGAVNNDNNTPYEVEYEYFARGDDVPSYQDVKQLAESWNRSHKHQYDLDDNNCANFGLEILKKSGHPKLPDKFGKVSQSDSKGNRKEFLTPNALGEDFKSHFPERTKWPDKAKR